MSETKHGPVMTLEERAKRVMFGDNAPFMDDEILTASHGYIISYPQFVAAIREAVKAEREACAELAATFAPTEPSLIGPLHGAGMSAAALHIAAAIRARTL